MVKVVATALFVFFLVESLGHYSPDSIFLTTSSFRERTSLFKDSLVGPHHRFIIGAILKAHPPPTTMGVNPPPANKGMAAMLSIYVCFYSMGWGPLSRVHFFCLGLDDEG
ncbi:hypothetical protein JAAARDRAFT_63509 [Jaapia argillacea MUCL 33604]|uniref:Uncharacterized protein n=1 Tax=Jaapia argillacea MUCL 33604 TaxID=933084 RepID=A0A067PFC7_9AGAM|nr:hypothetical protein JAAARDRAFT_63509 [Jaapia argillacea MUCL 33604]